MCVLQSIDQANILESNNTSPCWVNPFWDTCAERDLLEELLRFVYLLLWKEHKLCSFRTRRYTKHVKIFLSIAGQVSAELTPQTRFGSITRGSIKLRASGLYMYLDITDLHGYLQYLYCENQSCLTCLHVAFTTDTPLCSCSYSPHQGNFVQVVSTEVLPFPVDPNATDVHSHSSSAVSFSKAIK